MSALDDVNLNLVTTLDEAMACKRWLGERHANDAISVDTETTGLDPRAPGAGVRLIQFGDTHKAFALPWMDWRGLALEMMEAWEGDTIYHNANFERKFLETHSSTWKYDASQSWDTMVAAHIIDPLGSGALKVLTSKHIDRRAALGQQVLDNGMVEHGWGWHDVPVTYGPYWQYASLDCILTSLLWDKFKPQVGPGGVYADVMALEMATLDVIAKMERRGAAVDLEYSAEQQEKLLKKAGTIKQWGKDTHGINIASPPQLGKKLIELGAVIRETTPTGNPKVDKILLKFLSNPENELSQEIQDLARGTLIARESLKTANTYFGNFQEYAHDGLLRPSIKTLGARTARMSVSAPAMQQLSKRDGLVRTAFIPRSVDNALVSCDYSQIEARLLAHFSGDTHLAEAFAVADSTGGDFFTELGKSVYRDKEFQKTDSRRSLLKSTIYGRIYGAGTQKMAETAGISYDRMQQVVTTLDATYPGMQQFSDTVERAGQQRLQREKQGYVITPIGRRLPCDADRIYSLTNYLLQSTAADILKQSMCRLDQSKFGEYMVLPVHDEVLFDMPKELVEEALIEIPKIMEDSSYSVNLPAEAEGPFNTWGEKYA